MKKPRALFCVIAVILSVLTTSAFAAEPEETVIDLGDGYYVVETMTQYAASRSSDIVNGAVTQDLYYYNTLIGTATLAASFDISGSSARAISAMINGIGKNGGTYINRGSPVCSGNTAYGTAGFRYNGEVRDLELSISCDPDGNIH